MDLKIRVFIAVCCFLLAFLLEAWQLLVEDRQTRSLPTLALAVAATCAGLAAIFAPFLLPYGMLFAGVLCFAANRWEVRAARRSAEAESPADAFDPAGAAPDLPAGGLDIR